MKTLSLDLRSAEVLTKSELRQVKGGDAYCYCAVKWVFKGTIYNYDDLKSTCDDLCQALYGKEAKGQTDVIRN